MIASRHQKNIPSWNHNRNMQKKPYPSETQERFIVRLPDGMRDMIADAAKLGNRSMNAEIVYRLQASFHDTGNSETHGRLIVALTTLRILHRMLDDEELKRDIGTMLAFMGDVDEGVDVLAATKALDRLQGMVVVKKRGLT